MKRLSLFILLGWFFSGLTVAQSDLNEISLIKNKDLQPINVIATEENYLGISSLKVTDSGGNSEARFVKIGNQNFRNGTIELDLAGKPAEGTFAQARGFVGLAFRINSDNSEFECFYLRPTNGRADDQIRRNHSVQYISYPDFPWYKLRKDFPEKYESYVDLVPGEWTKVKIEVTGEKAKIFVHGNSQPSLIVNDLKLGIDFKGDIGLWIGPGTEAHFANLRIEKKD